MTNHNQPMIYADQLKHPKWQRRRLEILQRADFKCEQCGADDKTLHVHHRKYRDGALAWEYADDELVSLCEPCHDEQHMVVPGSLAEYRAALLKALALVKGLQMERDWYREEARTLDAAISEYRKQLVDPPPFNPVVLAEPELARRAALGAALRERYP